MKKTKEEVRDWLLENCINSSGNLDLEGLDFSNFEGDVTISGMIVNGNLFQEKHEVRYDINQGEHKVGSNLYQGGQNVENNLYQNEQKVRNILYQQEQMVEGFIDQSNQIFSEMWNHKPTENQYKEEKQKFVLIRDYTWRR